MSLKKQALNGIAWTLIQQFGVAGINFIVLTMILGRLLTPQEFGTYGLITVFVAIGNSISDSGMGQSIIRSEHLDDDDYGTIFLTNLLVSVVLYLIILFIAPYFARYYDNPLIRDYLFVFAISIILSSFYTIHISRLTKEMNFKKQTIIQFPSVIISGIVAILLAYLGYGVWSLVWMVVIKNFVLAIQYWFLSGWKPKLVFNKEKLKHHFDFGYKITLSGLLGTIVTNLIILIIGKNYTKAQVGFYNKAGEVQGLATTAFTGVLNKVTFPLFAKVKNDPIRLLTGYKKIQNVVLFVMSPVMLCMFLVASPLVITLAGNQWGQSAFYLKVFTIAGIFFPIHIYNLNILKVVGRTDSYLKAAVLKKVNLLVIILITSQISLEALVYGTTVHSFVSLFINMYYGAKELGYSMKEQFIDFGKILYPSFIIFGLFIAANYFLEYSDHLGNIIELILIPIIFSILYVALHTGIKSKQFFDFLDLIDGVPVIGNHILRFKKNIYNRA